jgi:protein TonB
MYEAMRQRAPGSTRFAGVATTALVLALAGYVLANSIGGEIMKAIKPHTIVAMLPPVEPEQTPRDDTPLEIDIKLAMPEPDWKPEEFVADRKSSITVAAGSEVIAPPGPTVVATATKSPALAPKLLKAAPPPYPIISQRAQEQGTTGLEVCVDARGRVTSASLAQTSGHPRLDEAALKWVRSARFTPGSAGGSPQAVCGHNVFYEWKLENARG